MFSFRFLGFPVEVQFFFWIIVAMLGGANSAQGPEDWQRVAVFVLMAFVAILLHEVGHGLVMRHFGDKGVRLQLHGMGGAAVPSVRCTRWQDLAISAAGPLTSIGLGFLGGVTAKFLPEMNALQEEMFSTWVFVTAGWGIFNLLPIFPLDGGRILVALLGPRLMKLSYGISIVLAAALCVWFVVGGSIWNAVICGLFTHTAWKHFQIADQLAEVMWRLPSQHS
jgi:stage IV sporulation protein FB